MKITHLEMFGYGKFIDSSMKLNPNLQVIYGNNEAGKSTIKSFISAIMFGLKQSNSKKFNNYKPFTGSSYGGRLTILEKNDIYQIERIKTKSANGDFTIQRNDLMVETDTFTSLLSPFTQEIYQDVFWIDYEQMKQISDLNEQDLNEQILSMSALGNSNWLKIAQNLKKRATDLYTPRAYKKPLNLLIAEFKKVNKELADQLNNKEKYDQKSAYITNKQQEIKQLHEQILKYNDKLKKLEKLNDNYPNYLKLIELEKQDQTSDFLSVTEYDEFNTLNKQLKQVNDEIQLLTQSVPTKFEVLDMIKSAGFTVESIRSHLSKIKVVNGNLNDLKRRRSDLLNDAKDEGIDLTKEDAPTINSLKNRKEIVIGISVTIFFAILGLLFFSQNKIIGIISLIVSLITGAGTALKYNSIKKNLDDALKKEQLRQRMVNQVTRRNEEIANGEIELTKLINPISKIVDTSENIETSVNSLSEKINIEVVQKKHEDSQLIEKQQRQNKLLEGKYDLETKINSFLIKHNLKSESEIQKSYSNGRKREQDSATINNLKSSLRDYYSELKQFANHEALKLEIKKNNESLESLKKQADNINSEISNEQVNRQVLLNSKEFDNLTDKKTQLFNEIRKTLTDYVASNLAGDWVKSTVNSSSGNYFPKIIKLANKYLEILTNGSYDQILFEEQQVMILGPNQSKRSVVYLSTATSQQLYLAIKFSFGVSFNEDLSLPFVIDDAFVDFDFERKREAIKLIKEISKTNQIILLTSDKTILGEFDENNIINLGEQEIA